MGGDAIAISGSAASINWMRICGNCNRRRGNMSAGTVANSETFRATTPSEREIRLTRLFDAPRHLVFEAMSKPEQS